MTARSFLRGATAFLGALAFAAAASADPDLTGLWYGHGVHQRRGPYATRIAISRASAGGWSLSGHITYADAQLAAYLGELQGGARLVGSYTSSRDRGSIEGHVTDGPHEQVLFLRWTGHERGAGWERLRRTSDPVPAPEATELERELAHAFGFERLPVEVSEETVEPAEAPKGRGAPPAEPGEALGAAPPASSSRPAVGAPPTETPAAPPVPPVPAATPEKDDEDDFRGHLATPLVLAGSGQHLEVEGHGLRAGIALRVCGGADVGGRIGYAPDGSAMSIEVSLPLAAGRFHRLEIYQRGGKRPPKVVGELAVLKLVPEQAELVLPSTWVGGAGGPRFTVEPRGALDGERGAWLRLGCAAVEGPQAEGMPFEALRTRPRIDAGGDTIRHDCDAQGSLRAAIAAMRTPAHPAEAAWVLSARIAAPHGTHAFQVEALQRIRVAEISLIGPAHEDYPLDDRLMVRMAFSHRFTTVIPFAARDERIWVDFTVKDMKLYNKESWRDSELLEIDRCPLLERTRISDYRLNTKNHKAFVKQVAARMTLSEVPRVKKSTLEMEFTLENAQIQLRSTTPAVTIHEVVGSCAIYGNVEMVTSMRYEKTTLSDAFSDFTRPPVLPGNLLYEKLKSLNDDARSMVFQNKTVLRSRDLLRTDYFRGVTSEDSVVGETYPMTHQHDIVFDNNLKRYNANKLAQTSYEVLHRGYSVRGDFKALVRSPDTFGADARYLVVIPSAMEHGLDFCPQPTRRTPFLGSKALTVSNAASATTASELIQIYDTQLSRINTAMRVVTIGSAVYGYASYLHPAFGVARLFLGVVSVLVNHKSAQVRALHKEMDTFMRYVAQPDKNVALEMTCELQYRLKSKLLEKSKSTDPFDITANDEKTAFFNRLEGNYMADMDTAEKLPLQIPAQGWMTFGVVARHAVRIDPSVFDAYTHVYRGLEKARNSDFDTLFIRREDLTQQLELLRAMTITAEVSTAVLDLETPDDGVVWIKWSR